MGKVPPAEAAPVVTAGNSLGIAGGLGGGPGDGVGAQERETLSKVEVFHWELVKLQTARPV
jgi:hypothetical protein